MQSYLGNLNIEATYMQKIVPKTLPNPRAVRIWRLRQLTGLIRCDFAKHFRLEIEKVKDWGGSNTDITEEDDILIFSLK